MRQRSILILGQKLPLLEQNDDKKISADWILADPKKIRLMLSEVQKKPSGGWFVLDDVKTIMKKKKAVYFIDGKEILVVRKKKNVYALSNICPHLGAPLSAGKLNDTAITCLWHGLKVSCCQDHKGSGYKLYNDGYLFWVQVPGREKQTTLPFITRRPDQGIAVVLKRPLYCDPENIIANRLDPWHGSHLHHYSFARIRTIKENKDGIFLRVAFRIFWNICVEVDACFSCPDPRTIVMTIIKGIGRGSVVETHATPVAPGYTILTELTIAYSAHPGFFIARIMAPFIRPFMLSAAKKLWKDDGAYVERRFFLEKDDRYNL